MNKKFSTRENVVKQVSHIINALSTKRFLLTSLSIYNLVVTYLDNSLSNSDNDVLVCSSATTF